MRENLAFNGLSKIQKEDLRQGEIHVSVRNSGQPGPAWPEGAGPPRTSHGALVVRSSKEAPGLRPLAPHSGQGQCLVLHTLSHFACNCRCSRATKARTAIWEVRQFVSVRHCGSASALIRKQGHFTDILLSRGECERRESSIWMKDPAALKQPFWAKSVGGLRGSSKHSRKPACKNFKTLHFSRVLN